MSCLRTTTIGLLERAASKAGLFAYWPSRLLACLRPAVLQRHGAIEDRRAASRIRINGEVALPLELVARAGGGRGQRRFDLAALQHFERMRIKVRREVGAGLRGR